MKIMKEVVRVGQRRMIGKSPDTDSFIV